MDLLDFLAIGGLDRFLVGLGVEAETLVGFRRAHRVAGRRCSIGLLASALTSSTLLVSTPTAGTTSACLARGLTVPGRGPLLAGTGPAPAPAAVDTCLLFDAPVDPVGHLAAGVIVDEVRCYPEREREKENGGAGHQGQDCQHDCDRTQHNREARCETIVLHTQWFGVDDRKPLVARRATL